MTLKVGIVGARGIGERHARAYSQDPLAELVAVCDLVKERADEAAQMHGVRGYTGLAEMLRHEELDIVDVSTGGAENGSWHFEPTMEALEAGKHVLVEKPISNQIGEARQMVAKAAEMDLYLGCNLNHYFTPPAEKARQYMEQGQIGEPVYCLHKMGFNGGEQTYQKSGAPNVAGFPYFHVKAFLAHPFSVMRHFCGDVTHVQAFLHRPTFRKEADDPMLSVNSIHLQFANGAAGYLLSQRGGRHVRAGRLVERGGRRDARRLLHRELHRKDHLLAVPHRRRGRAAASYAQRHYRLQPDLSPAYPCLS